MTDSHVLSVSHVSSASARRAGCQLQYLLHICYQLPVTCYLLPDISYQTIVTDSYHYHAINYYVKSILWKIIDGSCQL